MKKISFFLTALLLTGCGYTLRGREHVPYDTVFVPVFDSEITIHEDAPGVRLYFSGLEVELEEILKRRFRHDGGMLAVSRPEVADIVLEGAILSYEREALRYARDESVEEYRLRVRARVKLIQDEELVWDEEIRGETTYLTVGAHAVTELAAVREALEDLSRRIVDRIVEDW